MLDDTDNIYIFTAKYDDVLPRTPYVRRKSEICTPKRDDEHPHPFHMGSPPLPGASWPSYSSERLLRFLNLVRSLTVCCRKLASKKTANDARSHPPNIWVVCWAMHFGKKERSALWLNAIHSGKKWWIREFVPPYVFPLNRELHVSTP